MNWIREKTQCIDHLYILSHAAIAKCGSEVRVKFVALMLWEELSVFCKREYISPYGSFSSFVCGDG